MLGWYRILCQGINALSIQTHIAQVVFVIDHTTMHLLGSSPFCLIELLEEISTKCIARIINLQKAKWLQI
jgi:hypothetical protein